MRLDQLAAQIPWFHNCLLLDRLADHDRRKWYALAAAENGWSRNILALQIDRGMYERQGKAVTNFPATLSGEL